MDYHTELRVFFAVLATLLACRLAAAFLIDLGESEDALEWKPRDFAVIASAALVVAFLFFALIEHLLPFSLRYRIRLRLSVATLAVCCATLLYFFDKAVENRKPRLAISAVTGFFTGLVAAMAFDAS